MLTYAVCCRMSGLGDMDLTFDDLDADADGCLASTPHAADPPNNSSSAATQGGRGAETHADLAMSDAGGMVQDTQVLSVLALRVQEYKY